MLKKLKIVKLRGYQKAWEATDLIAFLSLKKKKKKKKTYFSDFGEIFALKL